MLLYRLCVVLWILCGGVLSLPAGLSDTHACRDTLAGDGANNSFLHNAEVGRKFDLTGQTVEETTTIRFTNAAADSDASVYCLVVPTEASLAYVKVSGEDEIFVAKGVETAARNHTVYSIHLAKPLPPHAFYTLSVKAVHVNSLVPDPSELLTQVSNQSVRFSSSLRFLSPYPTKLQHTELLLPTPKTAVHSTLPESPVEIVAVSSDRTLVRFGPFDGQLQDQHAVSSTRTLAERMAAGSELLSVHFQRNSPLFQLTSVRKEITVPSDWGGETVSVVEQVELENCGAKFKGEFSRLVFEQNATLSPHVVSSVTLALPPQAHRFRLYDTFGNLSSSIVTHTPNGVSIRLFLRFPLFGGWKAAFTAQYELPAAPPYLQHVVRQPGLLLNTTLGSCLQAQAPVRDFALVVTLPPQEYRWDRATVDSPQFRSSTFQRPPLESESFLFGLWTRSKLSLHRTDLVELLSGDPVEVWYSGSASGWLSPVQATVAVVTAVLLPGLLFCWVLCGRSGSDLVDLEEESRQKRVKELKLLVEAAHVERRGIEGHLDEKILGRCSQSQYDADRAIAVRQLKDVAANVARFAAELDALDPQVAGQARELDRLSQKRQALMLQTHRLHQQHRAKELVGAKYEAELAVLNKQLSRMDIELEHRVLDLQDRL